MGKVIYNRFSEYLQSRYGCKVYKLPLNLPVTCPNRDGSISSEGCAYCGEEGAGFENLPDSMDIVEQLSKNTLYISRNYKAEKFIAYFQNYCNTYLPIDEFKEYIIKSCQENIVAIYISTRPDCLGDRHLEFLNSIREKTGLDIIIELGLQTVNYHTLKQLNRGHTLAEFIAAILAIKRFDLKSCAHYIMDLPMDDMTDVEEGAKIISALGVDQVKCHSLYILKDTQLGKIYENGEIVPVTIDAFIERTITFLELLDPKIVVQRLLGRAPEERCLFCNWGMSWWKIRDQIEEKMLDEGRYQGRLYRLIQESACYKDL